MNKDFLVETMSESAAQRESTIWYHGAEVNLIRTTPLERFGSWPMSDNCVIVDIGFFAQDAHVIKTRLELEGIRVFLWYESHISLDPLITVALGGVRVVVHVRDAERAVQILTSPDTLFDSADPEVAAALERLWFEESVAQLAEEEAEKDARNNSDPPRCAECGSAPAVLSHVPLQALLTSFAVLFMWMLVACRLFPARALFVAVLFVMFASNNIGRWRACSECGARWKV